MVRPGGESGGNADEAIFDAVRAHARRLYGPAARPLRVAYWMEGISDPVSLPLVSWSPPPAIAQPVEPFVPNALQGGILDALEFRALRTDALLSVVAADRSRLYKRPGGIHELREHGFVGLHPRLGYYRPDAPPPELASQAEGES